MQVDIYVQLAWHLQHTLSTLNHLLLLQITWSSLSIMMSITDPNMSDRFTNEMEEIHNKQLKTYGEIIDATTELSQSHRQFVKSALGMLEVLF